MNFVNPRMRKSQLKRKKRHTRVPLPWSRAGHSKVFKKTDVAQKRFSWSSIPEMVAKNLPGKTDKESGTTFAAGRKNGYVWVAGKVPGVQKKNVNVTHAGNMLIIEGTRSVKKNWKDLGSQEFELEFSNSVELKGDLDWDNAQAYMRNDYVGVAVPTKKA
ncbi:MAG: Hsp20 family protein [Chitinivibrionales bacterium]|nr:Hsp20 family protein [Chitinivibrionales bacterium]